MSGPGGMVTKRDQRRESRRDQYQRRQSERKAERQRLLRQQQMRKYGLIGGVVLVVALLVLVVSQFIIHNNQTAPTTGLNAHPATGQAVDGMTCDASQGGALHIHQYLDLYINGQRVNANPGIGIVDSQGCLYPLHVHDNEANIIHNESNKQNVSYTLGQFFDVWGVTLSNSQVGNYKVDSTHKLVIKLIDQNGVVTTYTGNPHNIPLQEHETIYVMYNSPNVQAKPFTDWLNLAG
ncbi:MAG TPA: hypothetical protein VF792_07030 [Ktedonobacterales bacterium]